MIQFTPHGIATVAAMAAAFACYAIVDVLIIHFGPAWLSYPWFASYVIAVLLVFRVRPMPPSLPTETPLARIGDD